MKVFGRERNPKMHVLNIGEMRFGRGRSPLVQRREIDRETDAMLSVLK